MCECLLFLFANMRMQKLFAICHTRIRCLTVTSVMKAFDRPSYSQKGITNAWSARVCTCCRQQPAVKCRTRLTCVWPSKSWLLTHCSSQANKWNITERTNARYLLRQQPPANNRTRFDFNVTFSECGLALQEVPFKFCVIFLIFRLTQQQQQKERKRVRRRKERKSQKPNSQRRGGYQLVKIS